MKIFGFEIRKFEKEPTTVQMVETWVVKWKKVYHYVGDSWRTDWNHQSFIDKELAKGYAQELRDARKLLGDTSRLEVLVYKQETPTNV